MSTTSAAVNGHSDEMEKPEPKSTRQPKGGLVKAATDNKEIIVLEDNTQVFQTDTLPNNRPMAISPFKIVHTLSPGSNRPVIADTFEIATIDTLPGHRPVAVSRLQISNIGTLPGNRPIASNDIDDDPYTLMGYLD